MRGAPPPFEPSRLLVHLALRHGWKNHGYVPRDPAASRLHGELHLRELGIEPPPFSWPETVQPKVDLRYAWFYPDYIAFDYPPERRVFACGGLVSVENDYHSRRELRGG